MGDFNHPGIDWSQMYADNNSMKFLDLVQDCFLTQFVEEATHNQGNILDLVLATDPGMVENVVICDSLSTSDHFGISFDVIVNVVMKQSCSISYDYKNGDYTSMRNYLEELDWVNLFKGKSTYEMWSLFKYVLDYCVKEFVPIKKRLNNNKPKWMTKVAYKAINRKYKLWKRYRESGLHSDYVVYKQSLNIATREVRKAKRNFEEKLASNIKTDVKSFYAYTRSKLKVKDKVGPLVDSNGNIVTDNLVAANILNDFFCSVFTNDSVDYSPLPRHYFVSDRQNEFNHIVFCRGNILKKLDKLKHGKAPGVDSICSSVLKEVSSQICTPLELLFNSSFCNAQIPDDWKFANVVPIFKKGDKSCSGNYRPVSLTSHICKIMESIIRDGICDHLKNFSLIT